jgi:hypothetical protein
MLNLILLLVISFPFSTIDFNPWEVIVS